MATYIVCVKSHWQGDDWRPYKSFDSRTDAQAEKERINSFQTGDIKSDYVATVFPISKLAHTVEQRGYLYEQMAQNQQEPYFPFNH